jgi:hypothetical protein
MGETGLELAGSHKETRSLVIASRRKHKIDQSGSVGLPVASQTSYYFNRL